MKKQTDDDRDGHPFYSTHAKKEWEKRIKEMVREEKEISKKHSRTKAREIGDDELEGERPRKSEPSVRVVREDSVPKRAPRDIKKIQAPDGVRLQRTSPMRTMPQVPSRTSRSREPDPRGILVKD